jgi:hypothetical protein
MSSQLFGSLVRFRAVEDVVVGAGFLVSREHVLTCAHVLAQALHIPEDTPEPPGGAVTLEFPWISG